MLQQLERAEALRREISPRIARKRKAELGQFMTPSNVARYMASLFPQNTGRSCRLLDAGAGVGALSCAFLDRWTKGGFDFDSVDVFAYEIDESLRSHLSQNLGAYPGVRPHVFGGDFIELADQPLLSHHIEYTHAILNPPYKKIGSNSDHRHALRNLGIETVNLYSAFVALAVAQAGPNGQVVAIIPRSFCNGPYYRPFRDFILSRAALRHMHLFESRNQAFRDDDVLQENIIIRLECGAKQGPVTISTSTDDQFTDVVTHEHPFDRIVHEGETERFIHVPTAPGKSAVELSKEVCCSLEEIGVQVSTGPVVDFRLRKHLRDIPEAGTVPLLYAGHFTGGGTEWPKLGTKKPNAICRNNETEKWLYPSGYYCVVRRFSSKEEKRRIIASVVDPAPFGNAPVLGFENHLNVFHENRGGIPPALATGLAAYLNTAAVDEDFRKFNGHTQVNATDLRMMKYPSRATLIKLGKLVKPNEIAGAGRANAGVHDLFERFLM